jgi:hypothetical protein
MVQDERPVGLDGVQVKFDDERLVCDAGVILVALAQRLGLEALAQQLVRLRRERPGAANAGRKDRQLALNTVQAGDAQLTVSRAPLQERHARGQPLQRHRRPIQGLGPEQRCPFVRREGARLAEPLAQDALGSRVVESEFSGAVREKDRRGEPGRKTRERGSGSAPARPYPRSCSKGYAPLGCRESRQDAAASSRACMD